MCSTLLTTFRATATLDFMPGTTSSTACGDGDCGGRGGQDPDSKVRSVFAAGHARSHAKQTMPSVGGSTSTVTRLGNTKRCGCRMYPTRRVKLYKDRGLLFTLDTTSSRQPCVPTVLIRTALQRNGTHRVHAEHERGVVGPRRVRH